jgi:RNase P protein component
VLRRKCDNGASRLAENVELLDFFPDRLLDLLGAANDIAARLEIATSRKISVSVERNSIRRQVLTRDPCTASLPKRRREWLQDETQQK